MRQRPFYYLYNKNLLIKMSIHQPNDNYKIYYSCNNFIHSFFGKKNYYTFVKRILDTHFYNNINYIQELYKELKIVNLSQLIE